MSDERTAEKSDVFNFNGEALLISFVETVYPAPGVICDVYRFTGNERRDLGIIFVEPGYKTPRQKVLSGNKTTEGYTSGDGILIITKEDGTKMEHEMRKEMPFSVEVAVGEIMQWKATGKSPLLVYEICYPPYEEGRYEDLPDDD